MAYARQTKGIGLATIRQACSGCSLQQLCLPVGIDRSDVERLDAIVRHRRPLTRGSLLFRPGDLFHALYVVRAGSAKTYIPGEDGTEQITGFHLPGEIVGLSAIDHDKHPCGAKVLETTSVCEIPFGRLEELAATVPGLNRQLLRILSRELLSDEELLILLGRKSAEERLAAFLLNLSARFQTLGYSPEAFRLSMPRNDIANHLGLAVETLSRLFSRLSREGLIATQGKLVHLKDREGLRRLAGLPAGVCAPAARV